MSPSRSVITRSLMTTAVAFALLTPMAGYGAQTSPAPSPQQQLVLAPNDEPAAEAAGDYIVSQLVDGHVAEDEGGSTADVVLALVAVGGHDDDVQAATDWLAEQAPSYAVGNGPAAGKVALAAVASGRDPRAFGGVDLVEEVNGQIAKDGQCGEYGFAFGQALCILGLQRAGEEPPGAALDFLISFQDDSGAFGEEFEGKFSADNDGSGLALMALAGAIDDPDALQAAEAVRDYLRTEQKPAGFWTNLSPANTTGVVGSAMQLVGEDTTAPVDWLVKQQRPDGGLPDKRGGKKSDLRSTTQAAMLLGGESYLSVGPGGQDRVDLRGGDGTTPTERLAPAEGCTTDSGVQVVVDFGDGRALAGCAPGDPSSGEEATTAAGFPINQNASGLICQIDSHPDTCPASPPMDAYWSYWHATPAADGGYDDWVSSQVGAADHDPEPGSAEGWRFAGEGRMPPPRPGTPPAGDTQVADAATATPPADDSTISTPTATPTEAPGQSSDTADESSSVLPTVLILGVLALCAGAIVLFQRRGRRPS